MLATTLLVTTLLTVMLAASFLLVSAEQRTTDNSFGTAKALAIADAGLQNYFSGSRGLTATDTIDSMRVVLSGGYADVVARRLRPAGATVGSHLALWVVRSAGVATQGVMSGQTRGSRTIAQLAQLNPGTIPVRAAMVAANGVQWNSNGGNPVNGHDVCFPSHDTTGLSTPLNGVTPTTGQQPRGVPNTEVIGTTAANVYDSTHIDWASILAGNFYPDYTIPNTGIPPVAALSQFLVGYVTGTGTFRLPIGRWHGLLVVQGNIWMDSFSEWDGVIIAGGQLAGSTPAAGYTIYGAVITGLNAALPGGPVAAPNQIRRGPSVTIRYSSCNVAQAAAAFGSLVPIKKSWADTWSTY